MPELNHFNQRGEAYMVDVGDKAVTARKAVAKASVFLNRESFSLLQEGRAAKGDVLGISRIAGIMAAKKTPELIPLCHTILLSSAEIRFALDETEGRVDILATVRSKGKTGAEMEALTACSVAALTIYDMLKAVQRDIRISDIRLLEKEGGKSGHYCAEARREDPAGKNGEARAEDV